MNSITEAVTKSEIQVYGIKAKGVISWAVLILVGLIAFWKYAPKVAKKVKRQASKVKHQIKKRVLKKKKNRVRK